MPALLAKEKMFLYHLLVHTESMRGPTNNLPEKQAHLSLPSVGWDVSSLRSLFVMDQVFWLYITIGWFLQASIGEYQFVISSVDFSRIRMFIKCIVIL